MRFSIFVSVLAIGTSALAETDPNLGDTLAAGFSIDSAIKEGEGRYLLFMTRESEMRACVVHLTVPKEGPLVGNRFNAHSPCVSIVANSVEN